MSLNYITKQKLLEELDWSKSTLYRYMYHTIDTLPFIKLKRKVMFNKDSVIEWLNGREMKIDEGDE